MSNHAVCEERVQSTLSRVAAEVQTDTGHRQLKHAEDLYGDLWARLHAFSEATLITLNRDGSLRMSLIDAPRPDFHGNLWFFVSPEHPCLENVRVHGDICLTYGGNASCTASASLSGMAAIIDDPRRKRSRWNAMRRHKDALEIDWRKATLVRVAVDYFEYWDGHGHEGVMHDAHPSTSIDAAADVHVVNMKGELTRVRDGAGIELPVLR